jgi:hypothetical protein
VQTYLGFIRDVQLNVEIAQAQVLNYAASGLRPLKSAIINYSLIYFDRTAGFELSNLGSTSYR